MNRVLILGDGLLGKELINQTGWDYISRKKDKFDFNDLNSYDLLMKPYDTIINCIAYTNTYDSEPYQHMQTNFRAVVSLVNHCNLYEKKLVHISTDYIYAESMSIANEKDVPVHARNWYSYSKLLADGYVQAIADKYLLMRTSFKPTPFPYPKAITTQVGNFDYVDVIGALMVKLINKDARGIYNVGTNTKTIYELAIRTNPTVVMSDEVLNPTMPRNITMDIRKMKEFLREN